jgi:hypothetical protein
MDSERARAGVGSDESGSCRSWARWRWARCSRIVGYEWRGVVVLLNKMGGLFCGYCSGMESVLPLTTATTWGDEMVCEAAACDSHRLKQGIVSAVEEEGKLAGQRSRDQPQSRSRRCIVGGNDR